MYGLCISYVQHKTVEGDVPVGVLCTLQGDKAADVKGNMVCKNAVHPGRREQVLTTSVTANAWAPKDHLRHRAPAPTGPEYTAAERAPH